MRAGVGQFLSGVLLSGLGLVAPGLTAATEPDAGADSDFSLLQAVQGAARQLDYSGVFTYQQGELMLSSRVVHLVDGTGERERLEILDGEPREYLRHNDDIQCLIPEHKIIVRQSRRGDRFPGLLIGDGERLAENYVLRTDLPPSRIAGRACKVLELVPRDSLRYGYRLCTDSGTNLLLKAQTLGAHQHVIDQVAFTTLQLGEKVTPEQLLPPWDTTGWKVLEPEPVPVDLAKMGWRIPAPAGFRPVTQVLRSMKAGKRVSQLVLSDGLAAISVFIEPYDADRTRHLAKGAVRKGAMNVYGVRIGDHWLTAIGEVPADTLRDLAGRTEYVPLAAPR